MNRVIFSVVMLLSIASCSRVEVNEESFDLLSSNEFVTFNTRIAQTRATEVEFENSDLISVFASENKDGSLQQSNFADNRKYVFQSSIFKPASTADGILYNKSSAPLTYYAVYPYSSNYKTPNISFTVKTNQSNVSDYYSSNLMAAHSEASEDGNVELEFNHMMSKVVITLQSNELPVGTQTALFNNVYKACDLNLNTKEVTFTGSTTSITPCSNGANSFKVLLPPQVIVSGTSFFQFSIGGYSWVWKPVATIILNPGVEYKYTMYLN